MCNLPKTLNSHRRFRTPVDPRAPEYELKHRRSQSINAVNTEIRVMEERADDLNEKIEELNRQIVGSLVEYDETRAIVSKRMELDDQQIRLVNGSVIFITGLHLEAFGIDFRHFSRKF